jgi:hypothetical protein
MFFYVLKAIIIYCLRIKLSAWDAVVIVVGISDGTLRRYSDARARLTTTRASAHLLRPVALL